MYPERSSLLLVDDDAASRALLRRYLSPQGFEIADAGTGLEALKLVHQQPFDLVLLDVEMPDLGGMEVLRILRQSHTPADLPIMMATAKDRSTDVVEALRCGANDYVTKPFDLPVVLARALMQRNLKSAIDRARQLEHHLSQRNHELEQANRRMRQELEAAARVQAALLPTSPPRLAGVSFCWHYRPCAELAGDLLGLVELPGNRACLYVLDVVNHGVKAALLAVMINRVLSRLLAEGNGGLSPSRVAAHLHEEFPWNERTEQFFTLLLGIFDASSREFSYISAGMPGPVVVSPHGDPRNLRVKGWPIGLGDGAYEEYRLRLERGDRLYLYSDGLIDAMHPQQGPIGEERCLQMIRDFRSRPLADSVTSLLCAVEAWSAPELPHDDISLIAVEIV